MLRIQKYKWDFIGWVGALFALIAFGLNSFEMIGSQSIVYLGMYSLGCLLMAFYGFSKRAPASWILNVIFLVTGLIAIMRIYI